MLRWPSVRIPGRSWSDMTASTRLGFEIGKYVTFGSIVSMGFCAMLVGGVHGLVLAGGFGAVFGVVVGLIAIMVGAAADGTRVLKEVFGYTVHTRTVEEHAGQVSLPESTGPDAPTRG